MLALAMYARTYGDAKRLLGNPEASALADTSLKAFKTVATTVDRRCFIFHTRVGFFKPVADLAAQMGIDK
jgi:hypothetical protein